MSLFFVCPGTLPLLPARIGELSSRDKLKTRGYARENIPRRPGNTRNMNQLWHPALCRVLATSNMDEIGIREESKRWRVERLESQAGEIDDYRPSRRKHVVINDKVAGERISELTTERKHRGAPT